MLQKWLIEAKCIQSGQVKGYGGTEIHGWLFNLLRDISQELSLRIHDSVDKPFSIGALKGGDREKGKTLLKENNKYSFSVSGLNQEITETFDKVFSKIEGEKIQLGEAVLVIEQIKEYFPKNSLSYYDLLEKSFSANDNITLKFCSPTSFRLQGTQMIFPQPNLVWGSLFRKWNLYSPVRFSNELSYADILVKKYNLKTELVDFGKYKIIGCIGNCTYQLDKQMPEFQKKILKTLAYYGEIASCGYKTSMGMGEIQYLYEGR